MNATEPEMYEACEQNWADHDDDVLTPCLVKCVAGYVSDPGSVGPCTACGVGQQYTVDVSSNVSVCAVCAAGQYQNGVAQTSCIECPAGQYEEHEGQTSCTACAGGRYSDDGWATCSAMCVLVSTLHREPITAVCVLLVVSMTIWTHPRRVWSVDLVGTLLLG